MLGLVSDVHADAVALAAVLDDGHRRGVDEWWVRGDVVAVGVEPVPVAAMLGALQRASFLRGNTDRYVVTGDRPFPSAADVERDPALEPLRQEVDASFRWTAAQLGAGATAWLAALPLRLERQLRDGSRLVAVHASPSADDDAGITPETPDDALASMVAAAGADLLVAGHTHRATDRRVAGGRAVNPGSVGNPITDDPGATYVTVDDDPAGHAVAFHRVAYDQEAALDRIRRSDHPSASYLASFHRGEQRRHRAAVPGAPVWSAPAPNRAGW